MKTPLPGRETVRGPAPRIDLPDAAQWRRHVALLARRAAQLKDPVAVARQHHQRARVLHDELGDEPAAVEAWRAALAAWPGHLPTLLDLRDRALADDDVELARDVFDRAVEVLARPGADRADAAEVAGFFLLVWLMRWPDPPRARRALAALVEAGDPLGLAGRLGHLCLAPDDRIEALRAQLEAGASDRAAPAAELGQSLLDAGQAATGEALLLEAADHDPVAAWVLLEHAWRAGEPLDRARALARMAARCSEGAGPALRFLAGEQWEFALHDPERAEAFYDDAAGGSLDTVVALKRVLGALAVDPLAYAATLEDEAAAIDDPRLAGVLLLRAAQRFAALDDADRARRIARRAAERWPDDPRPRRLLERAAWSEGRLDTLGPHLAVGADPALARALRAALLEHGRRDPAAALDSLGPLDPEADRLLLRARGRLAPDTDARLRAWQHEANLLGSGERRADLYLRIARHYAGHAGQHEKALTYLFWVLDHDAEHLTALRLIEHVCRSTRRHRPLMEVIARSLRLLDQPEDRAPLQRELAALWEAVEDDPDRSVDLYRAALAESPEDARTLAELERLYRRLDRLPDLRTLYEGVLAQDIATERRAAVSLKLARLLADAFDDKAAAARLAREALATAPPGDTREALSALVHRLGDAPPAPPKPARDGRTQPVPPVRPRSDELDALDAAPVFDAAEIEALDATRAEVPPLPPLAPLPRIERDGHVDDEDQLTRQVLPGVVALLPEAGEAEPDTITSDDPANGSLGSVADSGLFDVPPAEPEAMDFLGAEKARDRTLDPGRAIIARKLRRSRGAERAADWPHAEDAGVASAVRALEEGDRLEARVEAAYTLGARYEALDDRAAAVRAYKAVLSYQAGAAQAIARLEALYRETGDWKGLAQVLVGEVARTGDVARKRALLLEVARLAAGPLEDPAAAVARFEEALALGPTDRAVVHELAALLRRIRRWDDYAELLHAHGLDEPEHLEPDAALDLGRVHLYERGDAARAVPYVLRAARALPDRVDVAADLAEARAVLGEVDRAVTLLEQAIAATDADHAAARNVLRLRLARLLEEHAHDTDRARRVYRDALDEGLDDLTVLDRVDRLAIAAQDWETLRLVVERSIDAARRRGAEPAELRDLHRRLAHHLHHRLNRPREAAAAYVEAFELDPTDLRSFRTTEQLLTEHPAPDLQIRLYRTLLEHTPPGLRRRLAVGLRLVAAYESEDRIEDAARLLEDLHREAPGEGEVLAALERVYRRAERWPALVEMYEQGLAGLDAPAARATLLRRLAQAYEVGLRDLPAATEVYRKLLDQDPGDAAALRALARLLEAQRRWPELLEVSERELGLTSSARQQAYIYFRMGSLHETQLHDLVAAAKDYRRALELDPRCFPALHGLREIAANAGHWATVVEYLRRELELWDEPRERASVLARIAEIYETRLRDRPQALTHYRQAITVWPSCLPAARALADRAFAEGRYEEAHGHFQVLTQQNLDKVPHKTRAELFYKRGVVATALGRQLEAIECLKLALEFDADHTDALHALVRAYAGQPRDEGFADLMRRLEDAYAAHGKAGRPDEQARIDILRGYAAEQALDLEAAAAHYARALELQPASLAVARPLVDLFVKQRRWSDATGVLRRFTAGDPPADDAARARYVAAAMQEGALWVDGAVQPGRAIECFQRVLAVEPQDEAALFQMAQCHYLQRRYEDARETMRRLLADAPMLHARDKALYTFYLGRIQQEGFADPEAAESLFRQALDLDPHCASALLALLALLSLQGREASIPALLRKHADPLLADDVTDAPTAALRTFVAGLALREGAPDRARRLLTPVAERDGPGARHARFALVQVHARAGDLGAARRQLYRALDEDVCDLDALRAMDELLAREQDDEWRYQVLSVLELLDALADDERDAFQRLDDRARKQRDRGGRALGDEHVQQLLAHPSFRSPLVPLIGLCDEALRGRFSARPRPLLPRAAQVTGRRHPFSLEVRTLQTVLGYRGFDLYFLPEHPELVSVWPGPRPVIVLGRDALLDTATTAERRFLAGRAAFFCRAGLARVHDLGPERTLDMLQQLEALFVPRPDDESPPTLVEALPERVAEALTAAVDAVPTGTLPVLHTGEAVIEGIARTADRAGLLTSGRLRAAATCLARDRGVGSAMPAARDLTWAVRSGSRLRDLVKYALSEQYHQLRHAAGLAL
ncbi:MAG: tetratricopeptide repeat protein [Myxococcales bacterium]|nr:tetratricopeptide repeat protein [Myxococcales bacterium]